MKIAPSDEIQWKHLMLAGQEGDMESFGRLLHLISPVIEALAKREVGRFGAEEDIVQESLLSIYRGRRTYHPDMPFSNWMFIIVKHKIIDFHRKRGRRLKIEASFLGDVTNSPAQAYSENSYQETVATLYTEIAKLSSANREALIMTKIDGYSVKETGAFLGVSQSSVKVRVHRAISALYKLMSNKSDK